MNFDPSGLVCFHSLDSFETVKNCLVLSLEHIHTVFIGFSCHSRLFIVWTFLLFCHLFPPLRNSLCQSWTISDFFCCLQLLVFFMKFCTVFFEEEKETWNWLLWHSIHVKSVIFKFYPELFFHFLCQHFFLIASFDCHSLWFFDDFPDDSSLKRPFFLIRFIFFVIFFRF